MDHVPRANPLPSSLRRAMPHRSGRNRLHRACGRIERKHHPLTLHRISQEPWSVCSVFKAIAIWRTLVLCQIPLGQEMTNLVAWPSCISGWKDLAMIARRDAHVTVVGNPSLEILEVVRETEKRIRLALAFQSCPILRALRRCRKPA